MKKELWFYDWTGKACNYHVKVWKRLSRHFDDGITPKRKRRRNHRQYKRSAFTYRLWTHKQLKDPIF